MRKSSLRLFIIVFVLVGREKAFAPHFAKYKAIVSNGQDEGALKELRWIELMAKRATSRKCAKRNSTTKVLIFCGMQDVYLYFSTDMRQKGSISEKNALFSKKTRR